MRGVPLLLTNQGRLALTLRAARTVGLEVLYQLGKLSLCIILHSVYKSLTNTVAPIMGLRWSIHCDIVRALGQMSLLESRFPAIIPRMP